MYLLTLTNQLRTCIPKILCLNNETNTANLSRQKDMSTKSNTGCIRASECLDQFQVCIVCGSKIPPDGHLLWFPWPLLTLLFCASLTWLTHYMHWRWLESKTTATKRNVSKCVRSCSFPQVIILATKYVAVILNLGHEIPFPGVMCMLNISWFYC